MKNQFSLFTDLIGEALALLCAFVLFFGYPNPAFATAIEGINQESEAITNNLTEDNSADYNYNICGDYIVVDGDGNTVIIQKGNDDEGFLNFIGTAGGASAGVAGTVIAISNAGAVAGLSGAGMTSGLAAIGGLIGGGMLAGVVTAAALPVVGIAGGAMLVHQGSKLFRAKNQEELTELQNCVR